MRVPVVEFDGIDIDQIPLSEGLGVVEDGLNRAGLSEGVPIAPLDTIVIMKLIAGRSQDLADVEAIVESGADREFLRTSIERASRSAHPCSSGCSKTSTAVVDLTNVHDTARHLSRDPGLRGDRGMAAGSWSSSVGGARTRRGER